MGFGEEWSKRKLWNYDLYDLGIVNTFFKKRDEFIIMYKSGGNKLQVDYLLVRRELSKECRLK